MFSSSPLLQIQLEFEKIDLWDLHWSHLIHLRIFQELPEFFYRKESTVKMSWLMLTDASFCYIRNSHYDEKIIIVGKFHRILEYFYLTGLI